MPWGDPFDVLEVKYQLLNDELVIGDMLRAQEDAPVDFCDFMDDIMDVIDETMNHAKTVGIGGLAALMDVYTLARMLRRYTPRATGAGASHPEFVQNAVVVGGSAHTQWMAGFFRSSPDFQETLSLASNLADVGCIAMNGEPLFP